MSDKDPERLTRDDKPQAVETLAAAFQDYPVMRYVLRSTGTEYENHLRRLVGFFCEVRYAKDAYVVAIRAKQRLAAVLLVDEALQKRWQNLEVELQRLQETIGEEAYARLLKYETISSREEPQEPHYFVGMIGVHPDFQGKGYAGTLLKYAAELSTRDPRSAGVCLSTEHLENVPFYQHFGYKVLSEVDIDELHSWCFFLRTS